MFLKYRGNLGARVQLGFAYREGWGKAVVFFPPPAGCHIQKKKGQQVTDAKASIPWRKILGVLHLVEGWGGRKSLKPVNSPLLIM